MLRKKISAALTSLAMILTCVTVNTAAVSAVIGSTTKLEYESINFSTADTTTNGVINVIQDGNEVSFQPIANEGYVYKEGSIRYRIKSDSPYTELGDEKLDITTLDFPVTEISNSEPIDTFYYNVLQAGTYIFELYGTDATATFVVFAEAGAEFSGTDYETVSSSFNGNYSTVKEMNKNYTDSAALTNVNIYSVNNVIEVDAVFEEVQRYTISQDINSVAGGTIVFSSATAEAGETITIGVTANEGYTYAADSVSWISEAEGVNHSLLDSNLSFTMPASNVTVTAGFTLNNTSGGGATPEQPGGETPTPEQPGGEIPTPIVLAIEALGVNNGTLTFSTPDGEFNEGDVISVVVTPDEGYRFVAGSLKYKTVMGGSWTPIDEEALMFTMPAIDVVVTAEFEDDKYALIYSGEVSKGLLDAGIKESMSSGYIINFLQSSANAGDTIVLKPEPNKGYILKDGSVGYRRAGSTEAYNYLAANDDGYYLFTMPTHDVEFTAKWDVEEDIEYNVTVYEDYDDGTVTVSTNKAKYGDKITITATPDKGYEVSGYKWKRYDDKYWTYSSTKYITMPSEDIYVSATFREVDEEDEEEEENTTGAYPYIDGFRYDSSINRVKGMLFFDSEEYEPGDKIKATIVPIGGHYAGTLYYKVGRTSLWQEYDENTCVMPTTYITWKIKFYELPDDTTSKRKYTFYTEDNYNVENMSATAFRALYGELKGYDFISAYTVSFGSKSGVKYPNKILRHVPTDYSMMLLRVPTYNSTDGNGIVDDAEVVSTTNEYQYFESATDTTGFVYVYAALNGEELAVPGPDKVQTIYDDDDLDVGKCTVTKTLNYYFKRIANPGDNVAIVAYKLNEVVGMNYTYPFKFNVKEVLGDLDNDYQLYRIPVDSDKQVVKLSKTGYVVMAKADDFDQYMYMVIGPKPESDDKGSSSSGGSSSGSSAPIIVTTKPAVTTSPTPTETPEEVPSVKNPDEGRYIEIFNPNNPNKPIIKDTLTGETLDKMPVTTKPVTTAPSPEVQEPIVIPETDAMPGILGDVEESVKELALTKIDELETEPFMYNSLVGIYDVTVSKEDLATGFPMKVSIVCNVLASDSITLLHHDGVQWETVEATAYDGYVVGTFNSLSPVAVVKTSQMDNLLVERGEYLGDINTEELEWSVASDNPVIESTLVKVIDETIDNKVLSVVGNVVQVTYGDELSQSSEIVDVTNGLIIVKPEWGSEFILSEVVEDEQPGFEDEPTDIPETPVEPEAPRFTGLKAVVFGILTSIVGVKGATNICNGPIYYAILGIVALIILTVIILVFMLFGGKKKPKDELETELEELGLADSSEPDGKKKKNKKEKKPKKEKKQKNKKGKKSKGEDPLEDELEALKEMQASQSTDDDVNEFMNSCSDIVDEEGNSTTVE